MLIIAIRKCFLILEEKQNKEPSVDGVGGSDYNRSETVR